MRLVQEFLKEKARQFAERNGCTVEGSTVVVPEQKVIDEYGTPDKAPQPWLHSAMKEAERGG